MVRDTGGAVSAHPPVSDSDQAVSNPSPITVQIRNRKTDLTILKISGLKTRHN